jgi:hypothetical protein
MEVHHRPSTGVHYEVLHSTLHRAELLPHVRVQSRVPCGVRGTVEAPYRANIQHKHHHTCATDRPCPSPSRNPSQHRLSPSSRPPMPKSMQMPDVLHRALPAGPCVGAARGSPYIYETAHHTRTIRTSWHAICRRRAAPQPRSVRGGTWQPPSPCLTPPVDPRSAACQHRAARASVHAHTPATAHCTGHPPSLPWHPGGSSHKYRAAPRAYARPELIPEHSPSSSLPAPLPASPSLSNPAKRGISTQVAPKSLALSSVAAASLP